MKRIIFVLGLVVILTACMAIGGLISYVYVVKNETADTYIFDGRIGGQQLYIEMKLTDETHFKYTLYSQNTWQIRSTIEGEYKIEDEQLYTKPNGEADFSPFGKINLFAIAIKSIDFPSAGVSFVGDYKLGCTRTLTMRNAALAVLFTGVGLSAASLVAIIVIEELKKRQSRNSLKEPSHKEMAENKD